MRTHLLLAGLFLCSADALALPQNAPENPTSAIVATRPCSANPVLVAVEKKKGSRHSNRPLPAQPAPVCIEVRGQGLEIQEFLQDLAREQLWRVGENRVSEDTWTYVRYFGPDELEKYADTKILIERVQFTGGKAAVTLRTTDIGEGFSRVQIVAQFQGEGSVRDRLGGQPGSVWSLNSKGVLEQELVTSLQTRYKPMR